MDDYTDTNSSSYDSGGSSNDLGPVISSQVESNHLSTDTDQQHAHEKHEENENQNSPPIFGSSIQNDELHCKYKKEASENSVDDRIIQQVSQENEAWELEEKNSSKKSSKNNLSTTQKTQPQKTPRPMLKELKELEYRKSIRQIDAYKSFMRVVNKNQSKDPRYNEILATIKHAVDLICDQTERGQLNYCDAVELIRDAIENNDQYNRYVLNNVKDTIAKTDWKMGFFQTKHEITLPDSSKKQVPRKVSLMWKEIQRVENNVDILTEVRKYIHNLAKAATKQDRWSEERTEKYRSLQRLSSNIM